MGWLWQQEREEKSGSICCAVMQPRRGRRIKEGGKKAKFQYFRGGQSARYQFASAASEKKTHEVGFFSRVDNSIVLKFLVPSVSASEAGLEVVF